MSRKLAQIEKFNRKNANFFRIFFGHSKILKNLMHGITILGIIESEDAANEGWKEEAAAFFILRKFLPRSSSGRRCRTRLSRKEMNDFAPKKATMLKQDQIAKCSIFKQQWWFQRMYFVDFFVKCQIIGKKYCLDYPTSTVIFL